MFRRLREGHRPDEGFTLVELMVVVLVIGILIATALPTYLGSRRRAQNRAAQSDLRTAVVAAKIWYANRATYVGATNAATGMITVERAICWVGAATASVSTGAAAGTGCSRPGGPSVSVAVGAAGTRWAAARRSASGNCYWIRDTATGAGTGTRYGPTVATLTTAACTGNAAMAAVLLSFP